jgi:hypothetical protein
MPVSQSVDRHAPDIRMVKLAEASDPSFSAGLHSSIKTVTQASLHRSNQRRRRIGHLGEALHEIAGRPEASPGPISLKWPTAQSMRGRLRLAAQPDALNHAPWRPHMKVSQ